jgi:pilin isopeptide linkage protein
MKKFLSLVLALVLCLSLGVTAFATEFTGPVAGTTGNEESAQPSTAVAATGNLTFDLNLNYKDAEGNPISTGNGIIPIEEVGFECKPVEGGFPASIVTPPEIGVTSVQTNDENSTYKVTVDAGAEFTEPGKYNYTITQTPPDSESAGVEYDRTSIGIQIFVFYDKDGKLMKEATLKSEAGEGATTFKDEDFDNIVSLNDLAVTKKVEGKMGSRSQKFDIIVTLKSNKPVTTGFNTGMDIPAWDGKEHVADEDTMDTSINGAAAEKIASNPYINKWYKLDDGSGYIAKILVQVSDESGAHTLSNIPSNVTYSVKEHARHTNTEDANSNDPALGYEVKYDSNQTGDMKESSKKTTVKNTKDGDGIKPDTGVILEFVPYVIILTLAVVGLVIFFVKRRKENED